MEARHNRAIALAARELIPRTEAESAALDLAMAASAVDALHADARASWTAERLRVEGEVAAARVEVAGLAAEIERLALRAPVGGTVEEVTGLSVGSFVPAAAQLAVISPATAILAEVAVGPRQIGLIRPGGEVRLQLDAYSSHDWGTLPGRVATISDDFVPSPEGASFRVTVALGRTHLERPDGTRAALRKGMSLTARFVVAERSLWQLLRDRSTDWIDPWKGDTRLAGPGKG